MPTVTKDPAKVAAGKAGMRARWGADPRTPPLVAHLDELSAPARRLILVMIQAAARAEAKRAPEIPQ